MLKQTEMEIEMEIKRNYDSLWSNSFIWIIKTDEICINHRLVYRRWKNREQNHLVSQTNTVAWFHRIILCWAGPILFYRPIERNMSAHTQLLRKWAHKKFLSFITFSLTEVKQNYLHKRGDGRRDVILYHSIVHCVELRQDKCRHRHTLTHTAYNCCIRWRADGLCWFMRVDDYVITWGASFHMQNEPFYLSLILLLSPKVCFTK